MFVDGVDPYVRYAPIKEFTSWCLDVDHCTTQVIDPRLAFFKIVPYISTKQNKPIKELNHYSS